MSINQYEHQSAMRMESKLYDKLKENNVRCNVCLRRCTITEGFAGLCMTRENRSGTLYPTIYGEVSSLSINPLEKKPVYHFYPGSRWLSRASQMRLTANKLGRRQALLVFYPHFYMQDLPLMPGSLAKRCIESALGCGPQEREVGQRTSAWTRVKPEASFGG